MKILSKLFCVKLAVALLLGAPLAASADWQSLGALSQFKGKINTQCNYRVFIPEPFYSPASPSGSYFKLSDVSLLQYNSTNNLNETYIVKQHKFDSTWNSLSFTDGSFGVVSDSTLLRTPLKEFNADMAESKFGRLTLSFLRPFPTRAGMPLNHIDINDAYITFDAPEGSTHYLNTSKLRLEMECIPKL